MFFVSKLKTGHLGISRYIFLDTGNASGKNGNIRFYGKLGHPKLSPRTYNLFRKKVKFLDHVAFGEGVSVDPE